jgi:hypothetical protein
MEVWKLTACGGELVCVDEAILLHGGMDCPHPPDVVLESHSCLVYYLRVGVDRPHPSIVVVESHSCLVFYLLVAVSSSALMRQYFCTVWGGPSPPTGCTSRVSQLPCLLPARGGEHICVDKAILVHSGVDRPHPPVVVVESHSCLVYYLRVAVSSSVLLRQYFCTVGWIIPTHWLML